MTKGTVPVKSLLYTKILEEHKAGRFFHWHEQPSLLAQVRQHFKILGTDVTPQEEAWAVFTGMNELFGLALDAAKIFRASSEQLIQFSDTPLPPTFFRMPFPATWIEFPEGIPSGQSVPWRACFVVNGAEVSPEMAKTARNYQGSLGGVKFIEVFNLMFLFFGDTVSHLALQLPIPKDWTLSKFAEDASNDTDERRAQFIELGLKDFDSVVQKSNLRCVFMVLSYLFLCTSQGVRKVVHTQPKKLNAKRVKSGKLPHPDYYEVVYIDAPASKPRDGGVRSGPSVRYDVRGHWRVLTQGRADPLHTWVRPHIRGLENTIYKPKIWAMEGGV